MEKEKEVKDQRKSTNFLIKFCVAFSPALILTQELAWITGNATGLIWFWIFLFIIVFSVIHQEKYQAFAKIFRITEIATFFAPITLFVLALITSHGDFSGAVIGTMVLIMSTVIAVFFGIMFHLIANSFQKKASIGIINIDMKKCPKCAELIKKEAIKCKHCGSEF